MTDKSKISSPITERDFRRLVDLLNVYLGLSQRKRRLLLQLVQTLAKQPKSPAMQGKFYTLPPLYPPLPHAHRIAYKTSSIPSSKREFGVSYFVYLNRAHAPVCPTILIPKKHFCTQLPATSSAPYRHSTHKFFTSPTHHRRSPARPPCCIQNGGGKRQKITKI